MVNKYFFGKIVSGR